MAKLVLKLKGVDNGFCRVYYRLDKTRYCFQVEANGEYALYICTPEGEPERQVRATPFLNYTLDKLPTDLNTTAQKFCAWVRAQSLPFTEHGPNGTVADCLCNECTAGIGDGA